MTPKELIKLVHYYSCKCFEVKYNFNKLTRKRKETDARALTSKIIKDLNPKITYREIATELGHFGGSKHCNIIHGIKKANNLIQSDKDFKAKYEKVLNEIKILNEPKDVRLKYENRYENIRN